MPEKEKIAKVVRIISVPPVMITVLIGILVRFRPQFFQNAVEIVMLILMLGILPVLAYPLQKILPAYREKGREGQRNLAFVLNMAGYSAAFIWAVVTKASDQVMMICATYFFSVLLLIICNKLIHFRASGHASSFTGPLIFMVCFMGLKTLLPCIIFAALILWSSLTLKRHTRKELMGGMAVCVFSAVLAFWII